MDKLYKKISDLCESNNISISKMCKDVGVSRGNISDLKMNRIKSLSSYNLRRIAEYFDVTVDYLLNNEQKEKAPTESDVTFDDFTYAMFGESRELTEEDRKMLLDMARLLRKKQQERQNPPK